MSNVVEATPNTVATYKTSVMNMFEDQSHNPSASNDWDFNDIGVKLTLTYELTASETVSKITVRGVGVDSDASFNHDVYLTLPKLVGNATCVGARWDANSVNSAAGETSGSSTYNNTLTTTQGTSLLLFSKSLTGVGRTPPNTQRARLIDDVA